MPVYRFLGTFKFIQFSTDKILLSNNEFWKKKFAVEVTFMTNPLFWKKLIDEKFSTS